MNHSLRPSHQNDHCKGLIFINERLKWILMMSMMSFD